MKTDYHRARADMSPRTLTEIRKASPAPAKKEGWRLSITARETPSNKLSQRELEDAKQQASKYYRR